MQKEKSFFEEEVYRTLTVRDIHDVHLYRIMFSLIHIEMLPLEDGSVIQF